MGLAYDQNMYMKVAFLLVLLGLELSTQPFVMALPFVIPIATWHIHMVNGLNNATLFVHCKSKDDDLGYHHLVNQGDEFQWTFKMNAWGTTLYWCFLEKPNATASFEAFWAEKRHIWLEYRCVDRVCIWTAKDGGIYIRNQPDGVDELVHKWVTKSI